MKLADRGHLLRWTPDDSTVDEYVRNHLQPQFKEVVSQCSPSFIYLDGEWEFPEPVWRFRELLAWLYNESACRDEVVVNDRSGAETRGKHGDVFSSEIGMERDRETKQGFSHKWIEDRPLADWSWNRALKIEDYLSKRDMIHVLVETVANGGNLHLAVSPSPDGLIPYIQQERLLQLWDWLAVNGEAIYGSRRHSVSAEGVPVPTRCPYLDQNLRWAVRPETPLVHYTAKGSTGYAICLAWPKHELVLRHVTPSPETAIHLVGYEPALKWTVDEAGQLHIQTPALTIDEMPGTAAFVFRLTQAR
jgi:alpha-L-fucosidase